MNGELVEADDSVLALESGDTLIAIAQNAEKRIQAVNKIKQIALQVTNQGDWIDENGKPYLQVSGAEKVGRLFGVSWRIDDPDIEEHLDGHVTYTYKGYFMLAGKEIEAIGTRSSKDKFFSKAYGGDVDPGTINRGNVKKAAYTNLLGNGITRLLGIRNMTWDELAQAGIVKGQSAYVDRSSKQKPQATQGNAGVSSPSNLQYSMGILLEFTNKKGRSPYKFKIGDENEDMTYSSFDRPNDLTVEDLEALVGCQVNFVYEQRGNFRNLMGISLYNGETEEVNDGASN